VPDDIFSNQKIPIWVNSGGSWNGRCWYISYEVYIAAILQTYFLSFCTFYLYFVFFPFWYVVPINLATTEQTKKLPELFKTGHLDAFFHGASGNVFRPNFGPSQNIFFMLRTWPPAMSSIPRMPTSHVNRVARFLFSQYTKTRENVPNSHLVPNDHKMYRMAVIYSKRSKKTLFSFTSPSKIDPNWDFCFENIPSGNPAHDPSRALPFTHHF
jgi:hypothetical protein